MEIDGKELIDATSTNTVKKSIKIAGQSGEYIGGGVSLGIGISHNLAITALNIIGSSLLLAGCFVGAGAGYYFTSRDCNQMIDAFAEFYKANGIKISHSYLDALKYLANNSE